MKYKFELNLQRMAMGTKALSLWEQPHIKNKIRDFFRHEYKDGIRSREAIAANEEKWSNLTKEVLNQLEPRVLPKILDSALIYVIREVGAKIYHWYEYVRNEYSYDEREEDTKEEYTKQIYWTPYGNIDEIKIFKSFLLDNPRLNIAKVYNMACNYCLEEYVNSLWQQIPKDIQDRCYEDIYKCYDQQILAYWECYRDGDLPKLIRYFKRAMIFDNRHLYNVNYSVEENMFKLSLYEGYSKAIEYFWNKLSDEEKDRNLISSIGISIKRYYNRYISEEASYKQEKYVEICTYLMSQMTISQEQELFKSYNSSILEIFLSHWPWQELLMPTLERMWSYLGNGDYQSVLNEIMYKIRQDNKLGYAIENSKYQRILHEIWNKSPACLKQQIDQSDSYSTNITTQLLDLWDLSTLKLIINDQDMVQRRWELIDKGYTKYKELIREDKYELLDQFIEEILKQEEVEVFKQKIDIWAYFIIGDYSTTTIGGRYHEFKIIGKCRDRYDLADKLLDWQTGSLEEREELKSQIDYIKILYYFIVAEKYDLADKFLDWRFKSVEEIKDCKNSFKDDKFSSDQIYKLWQLSKEDIEIARERSDKFLKWFLPSEEEIAWFKQEKLIKNDELKEILCHKFIGRNCFEIIEDFLEWCLLPQQEIKQLKQMIVDRTIWQNCKYDIANDHLDIAERFVKWAFDTEEQKLEFIKEFMSSDAGGLRSCNGMIRRASKVDPHNPKPTLEERIVKFNKFIDFWIKPLDNLNMIKGKIQSFVSSYREEDQIENHQIFMSVLDNLKPSNEMMDISCIGESSSMNF